jgi:hypothetical protein
VIRHQQQQYLSQYFVQRSTSSAESHPSQSVTTIWHHNLPSIPDTYQIVDCYLLEEEQLLHEAHERRPSSGQPNESARYFLLSIGSHMYSLLYEKGISLLPPSLQEGQTSLQIRLQESEKS